MDALAGLLNYSLWYLQGFTGIANSPSGHVGVDGAHAGDILGAIPVIYIVLYLVPAPAVNIQVNIRQLVP